MTPGRPVPTASEEQVVSTRLDEQLERHPRHRTAHATLLSTILDVVAEEQATYMLPNERPSFGYKDGISHPDIEGSGIPPTNPAKAPFKAGKFVLGYPNESG